MCFAPIDEQNSATQALPPADMLTLRAFISCPNPMLSGPNATRHTIHIPGRASPSNRHPVPVSALESAIRAQPRNVMLALCAALERVMRRCLALDEAVRAAEEETRGTRGDDASPAPEAHLLLLTYSMVR